MIYCEKLKLIGCVLTKCYCVCVTVDRDVLTVDLARKYLQLYIMFFVG